MLVKLEWSGYRIVEKLWRYVKPFYLIPERYGQTDRQTDRQADLLYWRAIKTTKINGSVECRWCMTKSPSITVGRRSRAWSPDINTATVSPAINKIRSWVARFSRSRLWQMVLKNTQQFNTFSLTSPGGGGLPPRGVAYIIRKLSSSWC